MDVIKHKLGKYDRSIVCSLFVLYVHRFLDVKDKR